MIALGQEITPGTKQALRDLGVSEEDFNEPALNKQKFLENEKKKNKFEAELDQKFREKFGIADHKTLKEYQEELIKLSKESRSQYDKMTKLKYEDRYDLNCIINLHREDIKYEYPPKESPLEHMMESYGKIDKRIKNLQIEGHLEPNDGKDIIGHYKEFMELENELFEEPKGDHIESNINYRETSYRYTSIHNNTLS